MLFLTSRENTGIEKAGKVFHNVLVRVFVGGRMKVELVYNFADNTSVIQANDILIEYGLSIKQNGKVFDHFKLGFYPTLGKCEVYRTDEEMKLYARTA